MYVEPLTAKAMQRYTGKDTETVLREARAELKELNKQLRAVNDEYHTAVHSIATHRAITRAQIQLLQRRTQIAADLASLEIVINEAEALAERGEPFPEFLTLHLQFAPHKQQEQPIPPRTWQIATDTITRSTVVRFPVSARVSLDVVRREFAKLISTEYAAIAEALQSEPIDWLHCEISTELEPPEYQAANVCGSWIEQASEIDAVRLMVYRKPHTITQQEWKENSTLPWNDFIGLCLLFGVHAAPLFFVQPQR